MASGALTVSQISLRCNHRSLLRDGTADVYDVASLSTQTKGLPRPQRRRPFSLQYVTAAIPPPLKAVSQLTLLPTVTFSSLLWAFNFGPKRDASGQPIPIDTLGFTDTANSHPLPFTASITPRFERVQSIMDELERV
jgi:hypothetical protein